MQHPGAFSVHVHPRLFLVPAPPEKVVAFARRLVGCRFRHQGRLAYGWHLRRELCDASPEAAKRYLRGAGERCDCVGMILAIAQALQAVCMAPFYRHGASETLDHADTEAYGHVPPDGSLNAAMMQHGLCQPAGRLQPGSMVLLRMHHPYAAQHVGILAPCPLATASGSSGANLSLIHAYAPAKAVVEHRLDAAWAQRVTGVFAYGCLTRIPRPGEAASGALKP